MAKQTEAIAYRIKDNPVVCPICQHDKFWIGRAQLNTSTATFFGFDWLNKEVDTLTCDGCGYVLWFDESPGA
ncbi:hypothetical protein JZ785_23665 [Alicyclobacillus curvatus]|jgi:hypothetical protein|nr:hypothetical protein JZ785_23665 [Alicyclobacillus curvatus]